MRQREEEAREASGAAARRRSRGSPLSRDVAPPRPRRARLGGPEVLRARGRGLGRGREGHRGGPPARRFARGGSTITQQLAKNLFFTTNRSLVRKLREVIVARWLEEELGKRRILELYLNVIEWGDGVYGAQAAAQRYYGKPASALDEVEAAGLAAMIPNPRRINPRVTPQRHARAQRRVLWLMRGAGYLKREAGGLGAEPPPVGGGGRRRAERGGARRGRGRPAPRAARADALTRRVAVTSPARDGEPVPHRRRRGRAFARAATASSDVPKGGRRTRSARRSRARIPRIMELNTGHHPDLGLAMVGERPAAQQPAHRARHHEHRHQRRHEMGEEAHLEAGALSRSSSSRRR